VDSATLESKGKAMFSQLFDPQGFAAPWGLRTAERRAACYNYSFTHGDCWTGPSWPYETARVLTAAANVLLADFGGSEHDHRAGTGIGASVLDLRQYWQMLQQYLRQHTATTAVNDTAKPKGSGHIFENLHPDLGYRLRVIRYATRILD
jgi:hypothetical protein